MTTFHDLAERIRKGEAIPWPVDLVLTAAEPLYQIGMWHRLRQPRVRVNARVISFGNITAGGTGKTPAVIERAEAEVRKGHRVGVLTRGYKASSSVADEVFVGDASMDAHALFSHLGDEPALILCRVPEVLVFRCADRVRAAVLAVAEHHCDTLILDDGFQAVRLERDENILVIDATNPFGNGHLIPRGILREPLRAMSRATEAILTRCDQIADPAPLVARIGELHPGLPVRLTRHAPARLSPIVPDKDALPLEALRGHSVRAVCGIGNPEAFFATIASLGAHVAERVVLPDHGALPLTAFESSILTLTTEKDAMRLPRRDLEGVYALGIRLEDYRAGTAR